MGTTHFRSASEAAYAEYLTLAGLTYQYEQLWGNTRPDFTIVRPGPTAEIVAIADIKDLHFSDAVEDRLAKGEMITISRNSAAKTRRLIDQVWRQFEAAAGYPCLLVLAPGGDRLPDHVSVMAAMLGDYTILARVPTGPNGPIEFTPTFGAHGKMIGADGNPANTRINAIGLLSRVCPDAEFSGFRQKIEALAAQHLTGPGEEAASRYLAACNELAETLTAEGYDLTALATQVEYVVNPMAAEPFPKSELARGYVNVWEYDTAARSFGLTHEWTKLSTPQS